jgi:hypothetical protein
MKKYPANNLDILYTSSDRFPTKKERGLPMGKTIASIRASTDKRNRLYPNYLR